MSVEIYAEIECIDADTEEMILIDVKATLDVTAGRSHGYFDPISGAAEPPSAPEYEIDQVEIKGSDDKWHRVHASVVDCFLDPKRREEWWEEHIYRQADDLIS